MGMLNRKSGFSATISARLVSLEWIFIMPVPAVWWRSSSACRSVSPTADDHSRPARLACMFPARLTRLDFLTGIQFHSAVVLLKMRDDLLPSVAVGDHIEQVQSVVPEKILRCLVAHLLFVQPNCSKGVIHPE